MKNTLKSLSVLGVCALLSSSSFASEGLGSSEGKFFIGGSAGLSVPLKSSFTEKKTKAKFGLSHSPLFSGQVGYHITDELSVDISTDFKIAYPVKFSLHKDFGGEKAKSKASTQAFMVNFNYNLADFGGFQPFFTAGVGMARVSVKKFTVPVDLNAAFGAGLGLTADGFKRATGGGFTSSDYKFSTQKHTANCFTWQVGLGVSKSITESLKLNLAAKMQVTQGVSIKYRQIDETATKANVAAGNFKSVYKDGKVKQTLGVGEFTLGFTYDLPF